MMNKVFKNADYLTKHICTIPENSMTRYKKMWTSSIVIVCFKFFFLATKTHIPYLLYIIL